MNTPNIPNAETTQVVDVNTPVGTADTPATTLQDGKENAEKPAESKFIDFAEARKLNLSLPDIKAYSEDNELPVKMPNKEAFYEANKEFDQKVLDSFWANTEDAFREFETVDITSDQSIMRWGGLFPYTSELDNMGYAVHEKPKSKIHLPPGYVSGAGHFENAIQIETPFDVANRLPFVMTKDGSFVDNKWTNRVGALWNLTENPDTKSDVKYFFEQASWGDYTSKSVIRSMLGGAHVTTPGFWKTFSGTGMLAGAVAKYVEGFGHIPNLIGIGADYAIHGSRPMSEIRNPATVLGNSISNFGKHITHSNIDQQQAPFSNYASFMYNFANTVGQMVGIMGMSKGLSLVPMLAKSKNAIPQITIGLASSSMAANAFGSMVDSGADAAQAGLISMYFGAITYGANYLIGANLVQKIGLRKTLDGVKGSASSAQKSVEAATGIPINKATPAIRDASAKATATSMAKGIKNAFGSREKISTFFEDFSKKYNHKYFPAGFMLASGFEEFVEEAVEELLHTPLEKWFNRSFARPHALSVQKQLSEFDYVIEHDNDGIPIYKKIGKDGHVIQLSRQMWMAEKDDYNMAVSILDGNMPFDAKFSWDEPLMALIGTFGAGGITYHMSGAHKAAQKASEKRYKEILALEIAKESPKRRAEMLAEVRERLIEEQKNNNLFGSAHLTEDGTVIKDGDKDSVSVADKTINAFMDDLELNINLSVNYKLTDPEMLATIKGNKYLLTEMLSAVKGIRLTQEAIAAAEENNGVVTANEELGITEKTTVDELKKMLQAYTAEYHRVATPKEGKKYSEAFNAMMLQEKAFEHSKDMAIRANIDYIYEQDGKKADVNSEEYKKLYAKLEKKIMSDEGTRLGLAVLGMPLQSIGNINFNGKRPSIYEYMQGVYIETVGKEIELQIKDINERIKAAQQQGTGFDQNIKLLQETSQRLAKFDMKKYAGSVIDADQHAELEQEIKDIQTALSASVALNSSRQHFPYSAEQSEAIDRTLENVRAAFTTLSEQAKQVVSFSDRKVTEDLEEGELEPSQQLMTTASLALADATAFTNQVGAAPAFEGAQEIQSVHELSHEQKRAAVMKAYDAIIEGTHAVGKTDNKRSNFSVSDYADYLQSLIDKKSTITDPSAFHNQVKIIMGNLKMIGEMAGFNYDFLSSLDHEFQQYSPLYGKEHEHLHLTETEAKALKQKASELVNRIDVLINNDLFKSYTRDFGLGYKKINKLATQYYLFENIFQYIIAENKKEYDPIIAAFNSISVKITEVGDKDSGKEIFDDLLKELNNASKADNAEEALKKVNKKIHDLEAVFIDFINTLSGKLDGYIQTVKGEREGGNYLTTMLDFNDGVVTEVPSPIFAGPLTMGGLYTAETGQGTQSTLSVRKYFLLTYANMFNRFGKETAPGKRNHTYREVLAAYRDVISKRDDTFDVPTPEQEMAVMHVLNFLNDSDTNLIHELNSEHVKEALILNSMFIRGYAGTGKTTQVIIDVLATREKLTGKKEKITIVAPTKSLFATHYANMQKLGRTPDSYNTIYTHELLHNEKLDLHGLILIDEASILTANEIKGLKSKGVFTDKKILFFGDDAQITPIKAGMTDVIAIRHFASERTVPLTEVFRTGDPQLHNLQDWFRKLMMGKNVVKMPSLTYSYDQLGFMQGGRYYGSVSELRDQFISTFMTISETARTPETILYVAISREEKLAMQEYVANKVGHDVAAAMAPFIKTVDYLSTKEHYNENVSGLSSAQVYFEFTPQSFFQKYINEGKPDDMYSPDVSMGLAAYMTTARVGLTGSSRAKMFLAMLGDPALSTEGNTFGAVPTDGPVSRARDKARMLDRMNIILKGKQAPVKGEETKEETPGKEGQKKKEDTKPEAEPEATKKINRNLAISEDNSKAIVNSKAFKGLVTALTTLNRGKVDKMSAEGIDVIHASTMALRTQLEKSVNPDADQNVRAEQMIKSSYFKNAISYLLTENEQKRNAAISDLHRLNEHYSEVHSDNLERLEKATINNVEAYLASTLTSIQLSFELNVGDKLNIYSPTLIAENVNVLQEDGSVTSETLQANPIMLRVVGFDVNNKPIVDIIDFNIHYSNKSAASPAGPHTIAKMGVYAAMLKANGYKLNSVKLYNYIADGSHIAFMRTNTLSDQEIVDGYTDTAKYLFHEQQGGKPEEVLATEADLKRNERIISDNKYKYGHLFQGNKGDVVAIEYVGQRTGKNNRTQTRIHFRTRGQDDIQILSLSEFNKRYTAIRDTKGYQDNKSRFIHRAEVFNTADPEIRGSVMSSTLVFNPEAFNGMNINDVTTSKAHTAKMKLVAKIGADPNQTLLKRYYPSLKVASNTTGRYVPAMHKHVIANEFTDEYMNANIADFKEALVEAQALEADQTYSNEEVIASAKEHYFHIVSYDNDPEFRFYDGNDTSVVSLRTNHEALYNEFMESDPGSTAYHESRDGLIALMAKGFEGDKFQTELMNYNIFKLDKVKKLHDLEDKSETVRVSQIILGNFIKGKPHEMLEAEDVLNKIKAKGFTVSEVNDATESAISGQKYFFADITMDGIPGSARIELHAKTASKQYILDVISDFVTFEAGNETFLQAFKEVEALAQKQFDEKLTEEEAEKLSQNSEVAKKLIEQTDAYQFIMANRSFLVYMNQKAQKDFKARKFTLNNREVTATGSLFNVYDLNGKIVVEVMGRTVQQKLDNTYVLLLAMKEFNENIPINTKDGMKLRVNPFTVDRNSDAIIADYGKRGVDVSLLVTNTEDLKVPEVYTQGTVPVAEKKAPVSTNVADSAPTDGDTSGIHDEPASDGDFDKAASRDFVPELQNTQEMQETVAEIESIIGKAGKKFGIQTNKMQITNRAGQAVFGQLVDNVIRLSGYEVNDQIRTEKYVGRHESMHFVMRYLLSPAQHKKIIDGIKTELGDRHDGTFTHLYEYAAEKFEQMDGVKKPKTVFEKFVSFIKELGNRFGLYRFSFNEMLVAADSGYYHSIAVQPNPNIPETEFDSKVNDKNKEQTERLNSVIKKLYNYEQYVYVRDFLVAPVLKANLPFGKSLVSYSGDLDEIIYRTIKSFTNAVFYDNIGNRPYVNAEGNASTVKEMGFRDYHRALLNKDVADYNNYRAFHLGQYDNIVAILKNLMPNTDIEQMYFSGERKYNSNKKKRVVSPGSYQKNFNDNAENAQKRMNDVMQLALSTIPLYTLDTKRSDVPMFEPRDSKYVPYTHVKKLFEDAVEYIVNDPTNGISREKITMNHIIDRFKIMRDEMADDIKARDAIISLLYEFGDMEHMYWEELTSINRGALAGVGYMQILKEEQKYGAASFFDKDIFINKRIEIHTFMSGIVSHFKSVALSKLIMYDYESDKITSRNNTSEVIQKTLIRNSILNNYDAEDNVVKPAYRGMVIPGTAQTKVEVNQDKLSIIDEHGNKHDINSLAGEKIIAEADIVKYALEILGIYGVPVTAIQRMKTIEKNKKTPQPLTLLNSIHMMMMATRYNAELSNAMDELETHVRKGTKEGKTFTQYDAIRFIDERMSDDSKAIMNRLDGFYRGQGYFNERHINVTVTESERIEIDGKVEEKLTDVFSYTKRLYSPMDMYKNLDAIAKIIANANMQESPSMTRTPDGKARYTKNPGSAVKELASGSIDLANRTKLALKSNPDIKNVSPLVDDVVISPVGVAQITYNSAILNNKLGFDGAVTATGMTRDGAGTGRSASKITMRDLHIMVIKGLYAQNVLTELAWNKVNIPLSPLSDSSDIPVLPAYFINNGNTEKIYLVTKDEKGFITKIQVNRAPFVNTFNDVVNHYKKRSELSTKALATVLGVSSEFVRSAERIPVNEQQLARIKNELEVNRDYIMARAEEGDTQSYIRPGNAVTLATTPFNHNFIKEWDAKSKTRNELDEKYAMLRTAISPQYYDWVNSVKETGALNEMFNVNDKNKKIKKVFWSEDENLGNAPELSEGIKALRNEWLASREHPTIKTWDDWIANQETDEAKSLYAEMMSNDAKYTVKRQNKDGVVEEKTYKNLKGRINYLKTKYFADQTNYAIDRLSDKSKEQWSPALEGLFMTYWAVNESVSALTRGDITSFVNPTDFVKRGSGYKAPGTSFDLANPYGIGETTQVAVFDDVAGFNKFLGVEPGSHAGRQMFTDGSAWMNPVWHYMLNLSAGGQMGPISDYANKTVAYGYDAARDKHIYFKFAQTPIDSTHFKNSKYHQDMMRGMLKTYYPIFENYVNTEKDWDTAVRKTAEYLTNPANWPGGQDLRTYIVGYVVYSSSFKQGLTGINSHTYSNELGESKNPADRHAANVNVPGLFNSITVPNSFLRLQNVNPGTGEAQEHSFATQLSSMLGVGSHNAAIAQTFQDALSYEITKYNDEINKIATMVFKDGDQEITNPNEIEKRRKQAYVNYARKIALQKSGAAIKGTKFERLLIKKEISPEILADKLFESIASYVNDALKPQVPGGNMVQSPSLMLVYDMGNGNIGLASDFGETHDHKNVDGTTRRLLRPISYFSGDSATPIESREDFDKMLNSGQQLYAVPAEIIMQFQYASKFGLSSTSSLATVMMMTNGKSLYESGLQRAKNQGAQSAAEVTEMILSQYSGTDAAGLIAMFKSEEVRAHFEGQLKEEGGDDLNKMAEYIGKYFYDLNNALDIVSVRIPTTNGSSAAFGRIVAFSDTGNTIYASPEKSILDGSDYDYDELHVFYPDLTGTERKVSLEKDRTTEENNNLMFDAIWAYYSNPANSKYVLSPIDLSSFRAKAMENIVPGIANTIHHSMESYDVNFSGVNLVGHFANQMVFTNRLMSLSDGQKSMYLNPALSMLFDENNYNQTINFISKLVNAATDNAKEGGLLGKLNIREAVTPVIAGMVLAKTPQTTIVDGEEVVISVEEQILNELNDDVLLEATRIYNEKNSLSSRSRKKKIYAILDDFKGKKQKRGKEFRDYAYMGEQLLRIGSIYKLIQQMKANKADMAREIYNIEIALGMSIEEFLDPKNLQKAISVDYSNESTRTDYVTSQLSSLGKTHYTVLQMAEINAHEQKIRSYINIPGIIASNSYYLNQLNALVSFKRVNQALYYADRAVEMRDAFLKKAGTSELLYEEAYNDYENTVRRMIIGQYMTQNGKLLDLRRSHEGNDTRYIAHSYDLSKASDRMQFVFDMPNYFRYLHRKYPTLGFLKNVDYEPLHGTDIMIANFRNSIYIDPSEKVEYGAEFRSLANSEPEAADAIRQYQLIVYGLSYRNGSFAEVIDEVNEMDMSNSMNQIYDSLDRNFAENKNTVIEEIAATTEKALTKSSFHGEKFPMYRYQRSGYNDSAIFVKKDAGEIKQGKFHASDKGTVLLNSIYPKDLYIYEYGKSATYDYVYKNLSRESLEELKREGRAPKRSRQNLGMVRFEPNPENMHGVPYSGSIIKTALGQTATIEYVTDSDGKVIPSWAVITLLKDKDNPVESKLTTYSVAMGGKQIEALVNKIRSSFKGIGIKYVDNATSMTNGIAYYYNGTVYINLDKVRTDTLFHELAHPLLQVVRSVNPGLYETLYNEAEGLLDNGDEMALAVRDAYPELSRDSLIVEIMSTVVGFQSQDMAMDYLAVKGDMNYGTNGKSIFARFAGFIKKTWNTIKRYFSNTYGVNIDPNSTTLASFTKDIVGKALRGENVLDVSPEQLYELTASTYADLSQQKSKDISNSLQFRDLVMNIGELKDGDKIYDFPQMRNMSTKEQVSYLKSRIRALNYKYQYAGKTIDFDPDDMTSWDAIIEREILPNIKEDANEAKSTIVKYINNPNVEYQEISHALGINTDTDSPIYSEAVVAQLLRNLNYNSNTRYYRYSDLVGTKYEYLFSDMLKGFDPIIAIEYDRLGMDKDNDKHLIISIYNIVHTSLNKYDTGNPRGKTSIMGRYINTSIAIDKGISYTNNIGDVSNVMSALIAANAYKSDRKVYVNRMGTISLTSHGTKMRLVDGVQMRNNIKAMLEVEAFKDDLSKPLLQALESFKVIDNGFDYEHVLRQIYMGSDVSKNGLDEFMAGTEDINMKKLGLVTRLKDIAKQSQSQSAGLTSENMLEIDLITKALAFYNDDMFISEQINTRKDLDFFQKHIFPQFDVNHEMIDIVRRSLLDTSMKNVNRMMDFKKIIDPMAKFFEERYEQNNSSLKKYGYDVTWQYYQELFPRIKDQNGVERLSGNIFWTTDKKLDPHFAEEAAKLDPNVLKYGAMVERIVTEQMVDNYHHKRIHAYGLTKKVKGEHVPYTREDAKADLFRYTSYRRGMLPLMPDTFGMLIGKGKYGEARKLKAKQLSNSYLMFEETVDYTKDESQYIDSLPDIYMEQFTLPSNAEDAGTFGHRTLRMSKYLGMIDTEKGYAYIDEKNAQQNLNIDLETLLEFFHMSSIRKINYEQNVLPLINGAKIYMADLQNSMDFKQENALRYLELFQNQSVEGRYQKTGAQFAGVNVDAVMNTAMAYASPLVMALNVNVGVVSAVHNFMMTFIEGLSNDLARIMFGDTEGGRAGSVHFMKASGLYFTHYHRASQLSVMYQQINPNDYEMVTHRKHQKRKKHIISDFAAQYTNWKTDEYARSVIMMAQMLKDGSFEAHTYNDESGTEIYDPRLDKRFSVYLAKETEHADYKKQEVLYNGLKKRLQNEGVRLSKDGLVTRGYSNKEARSMKAIADKYIVGAYGMMEKNMLAQTMGGRMFMMFTTWFMTKISMAVKTGSYIDEVGYYAITKDADGNMVPAWMREYTEGYLNTVARHARYFFTGNFSQLKNFKPHEKKNWARFLITLTTFLVSYIGYSMAVRDKDLDKLKRKYEKASDEDKAKMRPDERVQLALNQTAFIPDSRLVRNAKYAAGSLFVIPVLIDKLNSPFAAIAILRRAWIQAMSLSTSRLDNLKYILPLYGGYSTMSEFVESFNSKK